MRKIVLAVTGTVSGLLMLLGYHTSLAGPSLLAAPAGGTATTTGDTGSTTGDAGAGDGGDGSATGDTVAGDTVAGDPVGTRWGPVQVQITVAAGRVTAVTALQYPDSNGRDQQINSYALPVLAQEALAAQSAEIDHVSGATVTSDGYVASLQSALDRANL